MTLHEQLNDPWRRLIAALLLGMLAAGLPTVIGLWRGQVSLSERITRLEEYRSTVPPIVATQVQLQDQRLQWLENNGADTRATLSSIRSDIRELSRKIDGLLRREETDDRSQRMPPEM